MGSEIIYHNSNQLTQSNDYHIDYNSGIIRFIKKPLIIDDRLKISYTYFETGKSEDRFIGNGTPGPYKLKHKHPITESLEIHLGGKQAREFIDYIYKKETNSIQFMYEVYSNKLIRVTYRYKKVQQSKVSFKDSPVSYSVTYLNESNRIRKDELQSKENITPSSITGVNNNIIVLPDNPIDSNKPIQLTINGSDISESEYSVNYYEGTITVLNQSNLTLNNVKVSYSSQNSINSEHSIQGLSISQYNQDQIKFKSLPIKYDGIQKITLYSPEEMVLEEGTEYEIMYINNGENFTDIQIKFLLGNYSRLTKYPSGSDVIKFDYLYTPSSDDIQSESKHEIIDVRLKKEDKG